MQGRRWARALWRRLAAMFFAPVAEGVPEGPRQRVRGVLRSSVRAHGRVDTRAVEVVSFAGLDFPYAPGEDHGDAPGAAS